MKVLRLTGPALEEALEDVARLRIAVFRDWPYLYDGDLDYERKYLQAYQGGGDVVIAGAFDGDWLVGAATGAPLRDHAADFSDAFAQTDLDLDQVFYCGESVLLHKYRGRGIGKAFFDIREHHAREMGYRHMCFCAVTRPDNHPLCPPDYRPLDGFWSERGYQKMPGTVASFSWKDTDQPRETRKPLQFWIRAL